MESFVERRKRELEAASGGNVQSSTENTSPQSTMSFVERRKMELENPNYRNDTGLIHGPPDPVEPGRSSGSSSWEIPDPVEQLDQDLLDRQQMDQASRVSDQMQPLEKPRPGRDIPYLGNYLFKGLDAIGKNPVTETVAEIGRMFYTPGGSVANIGSASMALGSAATKATPNLSAKLSSSLGGRVAQGALREGTIAAPLTSANYLAQGNNQLDEAAEQGAYGAAFGAGLGGLGPVVGKGLKALGQSIPESKVGQFINSFDPPPNPAELPYKPYEDLNLLSRADSNTTRTPQQGARLDNTQPIVDRLNRRDAFNSPESQANRADSVLEQYRLTMQNKYDPKNTGENITSRMNRKEKAQLAQYENNLRTLNHEQPVVVEPTITPVEQPVLRREITAPDLPPANVDNDLLNQALPKQPPVQPSKVAPAAIPDEPVNIRANYKNQVDNGNFSDDLQAGIRNTDQTYDPISNRESLAVSNKKIADDINIAEAEFKANDSGGADHVTTGYRLMQEFDQAAAKQTDPKLKESYLLKAIDVANKLAADLTKAGQTSQAARVLGRLSPEGQLLNLTRTAERNGQKVTPEVAEKFLGEAKKAQSMSGAGKSANEFTEVLERIAKNGGKATPEDLDALAKYVNKADEVIPTKPPNPVKDELPQEMKDVRKRDKIVSYFDDVEQAALARIAARKNNLNSLPLPEWKDHTLVVASQLAKGSIKAATHIEDMVKLFGEEIRPVASQVFQKAQSLVKTVSRSGAAEGNLERANEALRRMTGEAAAEKAIVEETANHVRKLIADAKAGKLDPVDVQKLRDYADEIVDTIKDKKPGKLLTQEERYLQSVKSLAKKVAKFETEKVPADQANREVSSLLRQITKIADEGKPPLQRQPIDNKALSDIANDVMKKTRPNPKPTTLQEKIVEKYIKQNEVSPRDIDTLRQLAKDVSRLSGDQKIDADIAMQKILNSYEKSTVWGKAQALRYIGMLLNTSTQAINAGSGPVMATTGAVSDVFGTMLDIALNKTLKTPRAVTMYGNNPLTFIADYWKGLKTGAKAGWHGVNPAGIQGTNEIRGLAFKSNFNPLNWAERTLGAVAKGPDFATYSAVYKQEIRKQGFLDAKNKGVKGKQNIDSHVEKFVNDPPESAALQADRIGKNTTFQRSDTLGGQTANYLNSGTGKIKKYVAPLAHTVLPFVRTPINIASTAVTLTPAGIVKGLYQLTSKSDASRREAIRTLSLGVTGSAGLTSLGYYLNGIGVITGANDSGDKNVDNIREQAGKGKYRFNTSALQRYMSAMLDGKGSEAAEKAAEYQKGDDAFDYNKMQPLAFPTAIGASFQESKGKPMIERVGKAFEDSFGSLWGMSTLKGVQDVFQPQLGGTIGEKAIGAPMRLAESYAKSFSWSALGQEARRQDPIVRATPFNDGFQKDVGDYYKSRIPGLSQSLPARKTTLGQDKMNAPGVAGQYLNPLKSEVAPYNEAAKIITDLIDRTGNTKLAPKAPEKSVSGTRNGVKKTAELTPERYAQLQEEVGKEIISKVTDAEFKRIEKDNNVKLTDDQKMAIIEKIYTNARTRAADKAKRELGIPINK